MTPARADVQGTHADDDPAASMALLRSVLRDAELDYGERPDDGRRPRLPHALLLAGALALVALVLTVALVQRRTDEPAQAAARAALVAQVEARTAEVDQAQRLITDSRRRTDQQEQQVLARGGAGALLAAHIAELDAVTGGTAVTGPGVHVVVDDAEPDATTHEPPDGGRVLDRDLQGVVNGLWRVGAEAVAVNGRRLTVTSAIRTAGEAILVDFRPLVPPYNVEAIGDPAQLQQGFFDSADGAALRDLAEQYGIRWEIGTAAALTLPAATGSAR